MENLRESLEKVPRKSVGFLEDKIVELEHRLEQANHNVHNKEYLIKAQVEQLKKLEEMHIQSLDEIELLNCINRKTIQDLEYTRTLLTKYEMKNKEVTDFECQTNFKNQETPTFISTNFKTFLKQQEHMLKIVFNIFNRLRKSHTKYDLLTSNKMKLVVDVLNTEINTLSIGIEQFQQMPKDTCHVSEKNVNNTPSIHKCSDVPTIECSFNDIRGNKSIYNFNNSCVLSPVPEKQECDEQVTLLEDECELLRKSLDKMKKSFLINMNELSDAKLIISKFDKDLGQSRLENEMLKNQLVYYKHQITMLIMKIDDAMRNVNSHDDTELKAPVTHPKTTQSSENVNINDYFTNFLEIVNKIKSEKDVLYNTLIEHQKNYQDNLNELIDQNNTLKKKISKLTQRVLNNNNLSIEYTNFTTIFENDTKEIMEDITNKAKYKELNKIKECDQNKNEKEICTEEINTLLSLFNIKAKIDCNFTGDIFKNNLKHVCSLLAGEYKELVRLRTSYHEYIKTMKAFVRDIIQLMVSLGYKDVSCYDFTDKNMAHQIEIICTKIKAWHIEQIEQQHNLLKEISNLKQSGKLVYCVESNTTIILDLFAREINNWLNQLKNSNISLDFDRMETIDQQIREAFTKLQMAVNNQINDLKAENFELIKLNKNITKEIEVLKNNSNMEVIKEILQIMDVFVDSEGIKIKPEYTIHNVKDICCQIKACYLNNTDMLKLQKENLLKENNCLIKEIEILRFEEFSQDDINELITLTKCSKVLLQGNSKKASLKSIYREIQARFENEVQKNQIIKQQLEEIKSIYNELREVKEKFQKEHCAIEQTSTKLNGLKSILEEPCLYGDSFAEQIKIICTKFIRQIKMLMQINNEEDENSNQIDDFCNSICEFFYKNINEKLGNKSLPQIEMLQNTVNMLIREKESLKEDRYLKEKCLCELNEIIRLVIPSKEYIEDIEKINSVCKQIKIVLMQKLQIEQTCKICFETLIKAISQFVSFPVFPTLLFSDDNNSKEQLVKAFTALENIIITELKLKDSEVMKAKEERKKELDNATYSNNKEENSELIILKSLERIQSLENHSDICSENKCVLLKESVNKIKENALLAISLHEKYIDLIEKYYKQNSELEKQNEYIKKHICIIRDYKSKLKDKEKTVADLRREIVQQNESINMMTCKIEEKNKQLNNDKLEKIVCENEMLHKEIDSLKCTKLNIERNVEECNEEIRNMNTRILELVKENHILTEEVLQMEERIKKEVQEKAFYVEELKKMQNDYSNKYSQKGDFEKLYRKQEEYIFRIVEEKECYKRKLDTLKQLHEQFQVESDQLHHTINIYKIENVQLNSEISQLKEEIKTFQQQNKILNDSAMIQVMTECSKFKTKLSSLNENLNKSLNNHSEYKNEFELLLKDFSMCNDVLTVFNTILGKEDIQEQIVLLHGFTNECDTHVRKLLKQKLDAYKLLEMLIDKTEYLETEVNNCDSITSAVSAARSTIETFFSNLSKQDERYNETSCEITNNNLILKDKLKDLEEKKNSLKTSLQDLTQRDKNAQIETLKASSSV